MIQLDDEQYWLYAAVDTESNKLLYTKLEKARNKIIASTFTWDPQEKHDVADAMFLIDGDHTLNYACERHGLDFKCERHGNRNRAERIFRAIKWRTSSFSNLFSNVQVTTSDQCLRSFALAWNQLI